MPHLEVSKNGRKIANLEKKLRTVPTGQMVLQYVLPLRAARKTSTAKVTEAMKNVGKLLIHTSLCSNANPPAFSAIHAQRLLPQSHTGAKRFWAMRPNELYGAMSAVTALNPAMRSMMKITSTPYLSHFFSGDQL